jgi:TrmH family RNA methyltransferase
VKQITSRDNPFFRELKKLAGSARQRRKSGQTLLDGVHLLQACLDSGNKPLQLLVSESVLHDPEIARLQKQHPEIPCTQLADNLFAELSELKTPTGILALIEQPHPKHTVEQSRFALLLEDIQDPGNLGSMIRTAAAAGCDAVFLSKGCADAWSQKVLRGGMGGHFALSIHESADLIAMANEFRGHVYAAALQANVDLYSCDLSGNVAFIIGNEGAGLSDTLLRAAKPVSIPMPGKVESLNAAAAAAVCLFEVSRQRKNHN